MPKKQSRYVAAHRACREAIGSGSAVCVFVSSETPTARELSVLAQTNGVPVRRVSKRELSGFHADARDVIVELSGQEIRNAPSSVAEAIEQLRDDSRALALILDHVTDPHNFGAILRTADQFGADLVIAPGRRAAPLSAVAIESSAGTAQFVPRITVANLSAAIEELQKASFWVYAADMGGTPAHRCNLTGRVALVVGNEGKGVSRLVAERSDERVSIPRLGRADSLNVSVATGVLAYEIRRQQGWLDAPK